MGNKKEFYSTSNRITYGQSIIPIKRIESFTSDEWEEFIEEWLDLKKKEYVNVEKLGGAGDMGRDVVAYIEDPKNSISNYKWDCFQCKHYNNPITPTEVYVEFGKIIYYTFRKEYPVPQKYYFVAPKDCGTSLSRLLLNPSMLMKELKANWEKYCENNITNTAIKLEGLLLEYFESFDFSIFDKKIRKTIIEEHKKHPNHLLRFGGSLPDRPKINHEDIPEDIQELELNYINKLIDAYNSTNQISAKSKSELTGIFLKHFNKARESFHFAEQLRVFYRDNLPANTFEDFQDEIYSGVYNKLLEVYNNKFDKVRTVEGKSVDVQITSNPLKEVSKPQDRIGICHQLSNENKIEWENE